jgi:hypothetical protein
LKEGVGGWGSLVYWMIEEVAWVKLLGLSLEKKKLGFLWKEVGLGQVGI